LNRGVKLNGDMAVAYSVEAPERVRVVSSPRDQRAYRLSSIDMVRGLVIVIMAIDHVRDFLMVAAEQDPMANPNVTVGLFVTRWITHFCAPCCLRAPARDLWVQEKAVRISPVSSSRVACG
jgi:hypothetical protein